MEVRFGNDIFICYPFFKEFFDIFSPFKASNMGNTKKPETESLSQVAPALPELPDFSPLYAKS